MISDQLFEIEYFKSVVSSYPMHQKSSTQYLICTNLEVPHLSVSMCRALFALVTISTAQVWERRTFRLVGRDWAHPKHVGITMGMLAVAVARTSAAKIAPCILLDRHATSGEDVVELSSSPGGNTRPQSSCGPSDAIYPHYVVAQMWHVAVACRRRNRQVCSLDRGSCCDDHRYRTFTNPEHKTSGGAS